MICNELLNGQPRRSNRNHANEHIDLDSYHRLPPVTRKLISGWFTLAATRLENDEDNCFEAFIFAWIAFNGWASCIRCVIYSSEHHPLVPVIHRGGPTYAGIH